MNQLSVVEPKDFGIEKKQANELTKNLDLIIKEREVLIDAYEDVVSLEITEDNLKIFRELRLQIRDNRTKGIEKWHKENKAYFLQGGKFIDAIKRKEVEVNSRMEEKLLNAEKHFENLEKERLEKLNTERREKLSKYLEDVEHLDLSTMDEDVWNAYYQTKKKSYYDRIEAEKKAKEERLEVERRDKIESLRINKMAPFKEFKEGVIDLRNCSDDEFQKYFYSAYKNKVEYEDKQKAIHEENERLKKEAERKEKNRIKEREKQEAILKKEREEKAKLEAELKAKKEAELKAKKEEEERLKELAKAPVKEQLYAWINSFTFDTCKVDNEISRNITKKFNSFLEWSRNEIDNM